MKSNKKDISDKQSKIYFETENIAVDVPLNNANIDAVTMILQNLKTSSVRAPDVVISKTGGLAEPVPKRHYKKRVADSSPKAGKKHASGRKSPWTEEIDEFIVANSKLKYSELLMKLRNKFGVKTSCGALANHIFVKGLRSSKLRRAAEKALNTDDEEDLATLPPEDD